MNLEAPNASPELDLGERIRHRRERGSTRMEQARISVTHLRSSVPICGFGYLVLAVNG
jgi:hypothetical protein